MVTQARNVNLKFNEQMLPKIIHIAAVLLLAILTAAILANSMTKPIGHDEQMYCSGAVLVAQGKLIYRDFSYVAQMPYHPLICAVLFKTLNTTYYLLTVRILSSFCDILVMLCIVSIYRRVFRGLPVEGLLLGLAAAILYVFNPFVDYSSGFAWNHDIVILCVMLSIRIFQDIDFRQKSGYWRTAVIGALLTLGTFMRITTALVELLFFGALLVQPAEPVKQRFKNVLPFLIAAAVFSVWPAWVIAQGPRAFLLNLFRIPALNSQWVQRSGMFYSKIEMTFSFLTVPGSFLIICIAVYLCVVLFWNHRKLNVSDKTNALFAVLLVVVFFVIAFIPPTIWPQYFAVPVPFLAIGFAYPLLYIRGLASNRHFRMACCIISACVFVTVVSHSVVLQRIPKLLQPQSWVPIQLHRISEDIAQKAKSPKRMLTLAPLYALEGGCEIYTELSAGPFVYRIADSLSPLEQQITHTAGHKTLWQLLEGSLPSAVIIGTEPKSLEGLLLEAAGPDEKTWEVKTYHNGPVVYFRR